MSCVSYARRRKRKRLLCDPCSTCPFRAAVCVPRADLGRARPTVPGYRLAAQPTRPPDAVHAAHARTMGGGASKNTPPFGANTPAQAVAEHYKARAAGKTFLVTVRGLGRDARVRSACVRAIARAQPGQRVRGSLRRRLRAWSNVPLLRHLPQCRYLAVTRPAHANARFPRRARVPVWALRAAARLRRWERACIWRLARRQRPMTLCSD